MPKEKQIKAGQKTISIRDDELIDLLNKIITKPDYNKSLNKVFNDALKFGIPKLYRELFNDDGELTADKIENLSVKKILTDPRDGDFNEFIFIAINLLKELLISVESTKYMVASVFNLITKIKSNECVAVEKFESGNLKYSPLFIKNFEMESYRNIREDNL